MTVDGFDDYRREIDKLRRAHEREATGTDVGLFDSGLAVQAAVNEYGWTTPSGRRVPPRPAWRRAIGEFPEEFADLLTRRLRAKVAAGGAPVVDEALAREAGELLAKRKREAMRALEQPPNAPATLAQKRGDSPLIDTGETGKAIEVKVRAKRRRR